MQKPTDKQGALTDHIFCCIAIEHCIQDEANVAILGTNSMGSNHSCDDGLSALLEINVIAGVVVKVMALMLLLLVMTGFPC
jgi:hypothetical protein